MARRGGWHGWRCGSCRYAIERCACPTTLSWKLYGGAIDRPLCSCGRPATREVLPYLDADDGTYLVCDDDACIVTAPADVSSIADLPAA